MTWTPVAPRPVFCVIEADHRDVALADAVCAGSFTHVGITVDLGPEPDWVGAPLPEDEEWRIEWTKFPWALDLAHAFGRTGDERYLRAWACLVTSFIRDVEIGTGVDSSDVMARRVQNWIYSWSAFAEAPAFPGLPADVESALLDGLGEHVAHIRDNLTAERNHRTLELYALLVTALALPDLDADGELLALATAELHANLLSDVRADGVHREHSTHYHLIALRSFVGARVNADRFGVDLPAGYDERLHRACDFGLHCRRPDGNIPALSDSDTGDYAALLELAAGVLERPDLRWGATRGRHGRPPEQRNVSFPVGGFHVQRSGWGERGTAFADERFLIFDCGALGDGGHGHLDLLNVEIAAGGRSLVMDPGRYTYAEGEPNWRHWFKGTAAHNTVVVDGLDQAPYRRGKPRKGTHPTARLLERRSAPGLDVIHGEATSTCYDAVHTRRVVFVDDRYWVIEDALCGDTPHRYDLRWHLAPEAEGRVAVARRDGATVVRAPGVALVLAGDRVPELEAGWIAPEYGIKHAAPVVSVVAEGMADATFVTVVLPLADGERAPEVRVTEAEGTIVEVEGDGFTDTVTWPETGAPLDVGPLRIAASAGLVRRDGEGREVACAAGVGGAPLWAHWTEATGMTLGREGDL